MKKEMSQRLFGLTILFFIMIASGCGTETVTTIPNPYNATTNDELAIEAILLTAGPTTSTLTGWKVVNPEGLKCRVAIPDDQKVERDRAIIFLENGPSFTFEVSARDKSISEQKYFDDVEKYLRGFDRKVLSKDLPAIEGVACRAFAHESSSFYQIGKIYVTKEKVYVLTSNIDPGKFDRPEINFFFDNFVLEPQN